METRPTCALVGCFKKSLTDRKTDRLTATEGEKHKDRHTDTQTDWLRQNWVRKKKDTMLSLGTLIHQSKTQKHSSPWAMTLNRLSQNQKQKYTLDMTPLQETKREKREKLKAITSLVGHRERGKNSQAGIWWNRRKTVHKEKSEHGHRTFARWKMKTKRIMDRGISWSLPSIVENCEFFLITQKN